MEMNNKLNILKDTRVNCYSIITNMPINEYLKIVKKAYASGGGLEGQREPLKTSTAVRIRKRMIADLKKGAILPPIVLGIVVDDKIFSKIETFNMDALHKMLNTQPPENLTIIDGMQRTTALVAAVKDDSKIIGREIRIEYWIAPNTNSLIYRMLVLNTGQVPWDLRRQIEVVFRSMIQEIISNVPNIDVLDLQSHRRRAKATQFQASQLIELYLVFGARKEKVDTKEKLADDFTRQDIIEATGEGQNTSIFYEALDCLCRFDMMFDKYRNATSKLRFKNGVDLFKSQPARVGFIAAIAIEVLGRPGVIITVEDKIKKWAKLKTQADALLKKLAKKDGYEIGKFLDFQTLHEVTNIKTSKVGDFEREFFVKAFRVLIEEGFNIQTMNTCWRAY